MKINVVYPHKYGFAFKVWSEAIVDVLLQLGHDATINHEINQRDAELEIIQCSLHYQKFNKLKNRLYVMIQGEHFPHYQCDSHWQKVKWEQTQHFIRLYDYIWDTYQPFHQTLYNHLCIKAVHHKLGYHPFFDKYENVQKIYDVSFFGTVNEERKILLDSVKASYKSNVVDKEREVFINQSKINLNIHYKPSHLLQSLRVLSYLMCSKAFIITEPFIGDEDIKHEKHLIIAEKENFPEVVKYYLENDSKRLQIAEQGYEYLKTHRTLYNNVSYCLEQTLRGKYA